MWKCPQCETENSDWTKKCEKCQYKPPRERANPLKVMLGVAIAALIVGVGIWLTVGFGVTAKVQTEEKAEVYVEFSDPGMEKAVRNALGKEEGRLTEAELLALSSLNAEGCGIQSLADLELTPNLHNLFLAGNDLTDVSQVATLSGLMYLNVDENQIEDLSFVSQLPQLIELSANGNRIVDLSPLAGRTSMMRLYLEDNQITDISSLQDLRKLQIVWLDGNDITDFTPLQNKPYLREVHFNDTFYGGDQVKALFGDDQEE